MQVRDQNNRKPANQAGGPAPQTPRGFALKGKWQKDRRLQKKTTAGLQAYCLFRVPSLGLRLRRALSSETRNYGSRTNQFMTQ